MEPSRRNLSAAIAVIFLLAMASDVARVQAEQYCYYLSGTYRGWCLYPSTCAKFCRSEASPQRPGHNYAGGTCLDFPNRKCYCSEPCLKKPSGVTTMPAGGQGGNGARAHD